MYGNHAITSRRFLENRFYSNGTMIAPFAGAFPDIGMEIKEMIVNDKGSTFDRMMLFGIKLLDSYYSGESIKVRNGPLAHTGRISSGKGIEGRTSNIRITNSLFRTYPIAIYNIKGDLFVDNSDFFNLAEGIIIDGSIDRTETVTNNEFDTIRSYGIVIKESSPLLSLLIDNNTINFKNNSIYGATTRFSEGLFYHNLVLTSEVNAVISNNHIFQNNISPTDEFFAYDIYRVGNLLIQNNTAVYDLPTSVFKSGLQLDECTKINVFGNTFTSDGPSSSATRGIHVWNTTNSLLCCNQTISLNSGTSYFIANNATRIRGAINTGPYNEYALDFVNTMTGIKQIYPGNDWAGVSLVDDARFLGNIQEAIDNFFLVSTPGLPFYPNDGIDGPSQWFQTRTSNELACVQDPDCNGASGINCDDYPNDQLLLVDGYTGLHGEGLTWQARKHVLKDYWRDPSFGCNDPMSVAFKNNYMNTSLSKLAKISNDIDDLFQISVVNRQSLDNLVITINSERQAIQLIDDLLEDPNQDLNYLLLQRQIHLNALAQAWSNYQSTLVNIKSNILISIPALQSYLGNISPSNILETNDVYVTDIFLQLLLNPNLMLSSIQQATLEGIANQCPIDGGDAVIRARHLLNVFDSEYYNPGVGRTGVPGLRTKSKLIESQISISPNPGTGDFKVQLPKEWVDSDINIELYNSSGLLIADWKTKSESLDLKLNIISGIYYFKIFIPNGEVVVKKLVINR